MADFDFTIDVDLTEVRALLAPLTPSELPAAIAAGLRAIGTRVQGVSRASYLSGPRPQHLDRQSGALARSITVDDSALPFEINVGTELIYGGVHEFGARIRARGLHPMTFGLGPNGGAPFRSAREVEIPARPFLAPALEDVQPDMADLMSAAIEESLR